MGDYLVVALTIDSAVNKGPGRPLYRWEDRAEVLRALRCVNAVLPSKSARDAIRMVRPAIFVNGIDYADGKGWTEDVEAACREVGAEIRFTQAPKQSVTEIIRRTMSAIDRTANV